MIARLLEGARPRRQADSGRRQHRPRRRARRAEPAARHRDRRRACRPTARACRGTAATSSPAATCSPTSAATSRPRRRAGCRPRGSTSMTDDRGVKDMLAFNLARDTLHQQQWLLGIEQLHRGRLHRRASRTRCGDEEKDEPGRTLLRLPRGQHRRRGPLGPGRGARRGRGDPLRRATRSTTTSTRCRLRTRCSSRRTTAAGPGKPGNAAGGLRQGEGNLRRKAKDNSRGSATEPRLTGTSPRTGEPDDRAPAATLRRRLHAGRGVRGAPGRAVRLGAAPLGPPAGRRCSRGTARLAPLVAAALDLRPGAAEPSS